MFTGPVGPVEVFFYWPKTGFGDFYWPGAIGSPLASSPVMDFFIKGTPPHFESLYRLYLTIWVFNPSNAEATFVKNTKTQQFLKKIKPNCVGTSIHWIALTENL